MKVKWSKKFPKKVGNYWFYGYRWGKSYLGKEVEPEWMVVRVRKCANGVLYIASDGTFMYPSEVEDPHFAPLELPEFPS